MKVNNIISFIEESDKFMGDLKWTTWQYQKAQAGMYLLTALIQLLWMLAEYNRNGAQTMTKITFSLNSISYCYCKR